MLGRRYLCPHIVPMCKTPHLSKCSKTSHSSIWEKVNVIRKYITGMCSDLTDQIDSVTPLSVDLMSIDLTFHGCQQIPESQCKCVFKNPVFLPWCSKTVWFLRCSGLKIALKTTSQLHKGSSLLPASLEYIHLDAIPYSATKWNEICGRYIL